MGAGGMDKVISIWRELHTAFGIQLTIEEMIVESDCVAVRYTERGIFRGAFRGQPPTGKPFEVVAIEWFTVCDRKVERRWGARDFTAIARQIGLPLN